MSDRGNPKSALRPESLRVVLIAFDSAELCLRLAGALTPYATVCLLLPRDLANPHLKWLHPDVDFRPFIKPRLRQPLRQLKLMAAIYRTIASFRPDLIHLQKGHAWFSLLAPLLVRRYPLIVSIHDAVHHVGDRSSHRHPQLLIHFAYRQATRVIAHNEAIKRAIVTECGITSDHIDVVPLIERGDQRSVAHISEDGATVLFFGRIWPYKGLTYLIQAQPLITASVPETRFIIAGEGEKFGRYREMLARPDVFEVYNEFVSAEKTAELFQRASLVVLPYIEASQSGVIPVAYTHAKPVVATDVGGLASQVEHGKTGFLVPPRDPAALAERITELLSNPALRHELGANARQKLEQEWSAPIVAAETVDVYRRALEERDRRSSPSKLPARAT